MNKIEYSFHINLLFKDPLHLFYLCLLCSSPALQLLHGRTQVARCHHVDLPLDAVFGDERVKRVRQHAEEQREEVRSGQTADEFITLVKTEPSLIM